MRIFADTWLLLSACRSWTRADGFELDLMLVPQRRLMTRPSDEGRLLLAGLHLSLWASPSRWFRSRRPALSWSVRSDATEIATRLLEGSAH